MEENINNPDKQKDSLSILEILLVFLRYKWKIVIISSIVCVISIILYFFVFDPIFLSNSTIKSTAKSGGLLSAIEGGIPDIGSLDDLGSMGSKSAKEMAYYEEILNSRRCLENVINKFNLMERDESRFMDDEIRSFRQGRMVIEQDQLSGVMKLGIYDKDPVIARDILDYLIDQLDKINIELNVVSAKNNREFVEKRYSQAREDLSIAEDSLKSFQLIYGIAPDLQVKVAAQSEFSLEAELKAEEVKLDVLKKILSPEEIEVKTQEAKINSLKGKISEIQNSTDLNDFLRLGNSPQIVMSFLRLQREIEIQSKILSFLLPVYEQSKIEEKRETPTIQILDKPNIPEKKSKPKRLTMVVLFTFFASFLSLVYYVLKHKLNLFKQSEGYRDYISNFKKQKE